MKILAFLAAALLATSTLAAGPEKTAVIPVKGMSCGGCVEHVNGAIGKLKGVKSVNTDLDKERTTVVFDPSQVKVEQLSGAIAEAGYKPGKPKVK